MIIGITDTMKPSLGHYIRWIRMIPQECDIKVLSPRINNVDDLQKCDGLLLTGGGDVHPKFYHREDTDNLVKEVEVERDEFEFEAIRSALGMKMPILAICRGMQVFNVAQGGTLIMDLEQSRYHDHRKGDGTPRRHAVAIEPGTVLNEVTGITRGEVNTNHHQAVESLGSGLRVTARSEDGVIEAAEWDEPEHHPFLLLLQWHPERMEDFENVCSRNILSRFKQEVDHFGIVSGHDRRSQPVKSYK